MKNYEFTKTIAGINWATPNTTLPNEDINYKNYVWVNPQIPKLVQSKLNMQNIRKDHLDHYIYICGVITRLTKFDKRFSDLEFAPFNYKIATQVINKNWYSEIINNLMNWSVIDCDNHVIIGQKSKGYKILPPYDMNFKKWTLTDSKINAKLNAFKFNLNLTIDNLSPAYLYLKNCISRIKIKRNLALKYNRENYYMQDKMKTYDYNYYSISNISTGAYNFTVDTTGNRVHTNLTNLKKDFRQFITVDNEGLGEVDVPNSQPLFFYLHIKDLDEIREAEKLNYKSLVESGKFYDFFMSKLNIPQEQKKETKKSVIANVFYDFLRSTESRFIRVFKNEFPTINNYIQQIKKEDHYKLPAILQKAESNFVIEKVVQEFINQYGDCNEFIGTIHDSLVAKNSYLEEVKAIMENCFKQEGINPPLTTKHYNINKPRENLSPYVS